MVQIIVIFSEYFWFDSYTTHADISGDSIVKKFDCINETPICVDSCPFNSHG